MVGNAFFFKLSGRLTTRSKLRFKKFKWSFDSAVQTVFSLKHSLYPFGNQKTEILIVVGPTKK